MKAQIIGMLLTFSLSSFGVTGWIALGAAALVAIGCTGELFLIFRAPPEEKAQTTPDEAAGLPAPSQPIELAQAAEPLARNEETEKRKKWEKQKHFWERVFVAMVAIGVTAELCNLPVELKEVADLNATNLVLRSNVADINTANLVLRSNVAALEIQSAETEMQLAYVKRREIKDKERDDFITSLKDTQSKGAVILGTLKHGTNAHEKALAAEAQYFRGHIEKLLGRAGYFVVSKKEYDCVPFRYGMSYVKVPILVSSDPGGLRASQEAESRARDLARAFHQIGYDTSTMRAPEHFPCAKGANLLGSNDVVVFILSLPHWERTDLTNEKKVQWPNF